MLDHTVVNEVEGEGGKYPGITRRKSHRKSQEEVELRENFTHNPLFEYDRFPKYTWLQTILFWIYAPFGFWLMCVRAFLLFGMQAVVFDFLRIDNYTLRPILFFCGFITVSKARYRLEEKGRPNIIITNHVTDIDAIVVQGYTTSQALISQRRWETYHNLKRFFKGFHNWVVFYAESCELKRARVREEIKTYLVSEQARKTPLFCCAEGGLTNGKHGLMLYNKYLFSLGLPVMPIAIKYINPWPIHHDTLDAASITNIFWMLFLPFTIFDVFFMPAMYPRTDEDPREFAKRVQAETAKELDIRNTNFSFRDKSAICRSRVARKVAHPWWQ
eukprot:Nk52_evm23s2640 gene=Nk52_evmTU23s2640